MPGDGRQLDSFVHHAQATTDFILMAFCSVYKDSPTSPSASDTSNRSATQSGFSVKENHMVNVSFK